MAKAAAKPASITEVRTPAGRWVKGQSGNPRGAPKTDPGIRQLAQLLQQARYYGATVTISFAPTMEAEVR